MKGKNELRWIYLFLFLLLGHGAMAQHLVKGTVSDAETGETLPGADILEVGTYNGTTTDINGKFTLEVSSPDATLKISFVGYEPVEIAVNGRSEIDVRLKPGHLLEEVVVVGYGTTQTRDLTGSVTAITQEDFQKGNVSTPEQLVMGKIAGVKINTNSGLPGAGSRIRIRGGSSLNASNDPLIVIDGVPVDNTGIAGSANALNLINPAEIESITVLKDASAAAIYGSRAANGVILITTKKGKSGRFRVDFSSTNSLSQNPHTYPVLSADEYRQLVQEKGTNKEISLLGTASTDWQSQIYRTGLSSQNNLTFSGGLDALPYRLNVEYYHNEGVLKRSQLDRYGASLNLSPSLIDDHLRFDVNGKFSRTDNFFADQGAIGSAVTFDPTKPVNTDTSYIVDGKEENYGGYWEWVLSSGKPNALAPKNPVGLLMQRDDISAVNRFIGNTKIDYDLPFLEGLTATMNLGLDVSRSHGSVYVPASAASAFHRGGVDNLYEQSKNNKLFELYGTYSRDLPSNSKMELTGGYSYQNWLTKSPAQADVNALGDTISPPGIPFETENTLISFYGRLNYTYNGRYLLTATLRDDGSSRFSPDTRWGLFPSLALAWRISDEPFMSDSKTSLKLRLGYGVTGQQDIGNDYPYIPNYDRGTSTAQYQFGDKFYTVLRPDGYDANIKWEETASFNLGLDIGFMNNRLNSTIDFYHKNTKDLLAVVPVPAGTNFTNRIFTNVGSLQNTGVELTVGYIAIDNASTRLEFNVNGSWNTNKITNLNKSGDPNDPGILVGGIPGGIGNTVQIHAIGYPAYSYLVYQQVYDDQGKPVEDTYVNLTGDDPTEITPGRSDLGLGDQYIFDGTPEARFFSGFSAYLGYKKWNFSMTLRGEFGAYIYNGIAAQRGYFKAIDPQSGSYLTNLTRDYYKSEFFDGDITQFLSDYYLEKGDFLRMDNLTVGYDVGEISKGVSLRVNGVIQNAFVITNYSGIDPEVIGGIDNSFYPRPRIYSLSFNLNF